jgi:hypothetical protein
VRRAIVVVGSKLPHGWRDLWIQLAVLGTFNLSYEGARALAALIDEQPDAIANGYRIMNAEQGLGIYWEPAVQAWALHRAPHLVMTIADWTYWNCQFTISFAVLLWVYLRRNHAFYFVRNTILFADFIGLIGYLALPTAPPRMFAGFDDVLNQEAVNLHSSLIQVFANPYAAMPSLHTAYAFVIGATAALVCQNRAGRVLWAVYPALVVFAIIATANHWVLDAVAGLTVAGIATALSLAVSRGAPPRRGRRPVGFLVP